MTGGMYIFSTCRRYLSVCALRSSPAHLAQRAQMVHDAVVVHDLDRIVGFPMGAHRLLLEQLVAPEEALNLRLGKRPNRTRRTQRLERE